MQSDQTVGRPTSNSYLEMPKNDYGQCQKWKVDSFHLRNPAGQGLIDW